MLFSVVYYKIYVMNGKVFVFSGTGNNLASAKRLASEFDLEIVHITDELGDKKPSFEGETGILLFPTYGLGVPDTVRKFIGSGNFNFGYMAVLTAMGSHHGGSLAEAIRCFKKRGQKVHYSRGILSVENFTHLFGYGPIKKADFKIERQRKITAEIAGDLRQGKTNKRILFRPLSFLVACITKKGTKIFTTRYKFLPQCTACGFCVKICPANALSMVQTAGGAKPKITRMKCDNCQGCLQLCPNKAIKFGRVKPESMRYIHKDVTPEELIKR